MASLSLTIRRDLITTDDNICRYCLQPFSIGKLTLDHVIPRSWFTIYRGKLKPHIIQPYINNKNNLILACSPCNDAKKNKLIPFYPPYRMYESGILYDYLYLDLITPDFKEIWLEKNIQIRQSQLSQLFGSSSSMMKCAPIERLRQDYPRTYTRHYNIDVALNVIPRKELDISFDQRFKHSKLHH